MMTCNLHLLIRNKTDLLSKEIMTPLVGRWLLGGLGRMSLVRGRSNKVHGLLSPNRFIEHCLSIIDTTTNHLQRPLHLGLGTHGTRVNPYWDFSWNWRKIWA